MTYIGRFAPSPTGPLHFGSLLAALASYLDARSAEGEWLLRIEDLDPLREQACYKQQIPNTLEQFGLYWDHELVLQSERLDLYEEVIAELNDLNVSYRCSCSRKTVLTRSGSPQYDDHCLHHPPPLDEASAIRVHCDNTLISFRDIIQGAQAYNLKMSSGDFIIKRKDQLIAYQLAVVVDDHLQDITHVVRGSDLLNETPRQIYLQQLLGYLNPVYAHIPVATNYQGQKLSKQTYAPALDESNPVPQLYQALVFLQQHPPAELLQASRDELLRWAIENWDIRSVAQTDGQVVDGAD